MTCTVHALDQLAIKSSTVQHYGWMVRATAILHYLGTISGKGNYLWQPHLFRGGGGGGGVMSRPSVARQTIYAYNYYSKSS